MSKVLNDEALDQLFREARTHNAWLDEPVTDDDIRRIYDLMKWGNGGSVAIGHPFGATGARILSQSIKEIAAMPSGSRAVVSVCADGGVGTVALLQS